MKKLKKRKGITLVEVLISLVLIGVIAGGLLTFFSSGYHNILRQRSQNKINFEIQESFETQLAEIKKKGGEGTEVETFEYSIGGRAQTPINVTGQTLSYSKNKARNIHLFAANERESVLDIPKDLQVKVDGAKRYYYVGEMTKGGKVGYENGVQNSKAKIYIESGWFLSDRSIGSSTSGVVPVATIGNASETTMSQLVLPELPADFRQHSDRDSGVRITNEMRGRYLTFAARAINSYGRVGNYQEAENRIWVMGLPFTENLLLHTDADLAVMNNDARIPTDNTSYTNVKIRNYYEKTNPKQLNYSNVPVLNYYESQIEQARQLIALDGREVPFSNQNFNNGLTTSILIGNRQQTGPLLTYKLDNTQGKLLALGIHLENDGRMAIIRRDNTTTDEGVKEYVSVKLDYTKDNTIQVRSKAQGANLNIEIFVNGVSLVTKSIPLAGHNISRGQIVFSGHTYINEFAVYTAALENADMNQILYYFRDKYKAK